ncbi:hypothetical protein KFE98_01900 [bacterium SCSIO 12741]|nr:hypothetical protein KFE98_01900 [bacterium SCSIO 12741]
MKKLLIPLIVVLIWGCNSSQITQASKQNIRPGVPSAPAYRQYSIEILRKSAQLAQIDSVIVRDGQTCYNVGFSLVKSGSSMQLQKMDSEGTYLIEASMRKEQIASERSCDSSEEKVILYLTENGKAKTFEVDSFKIEDINRR